MTPFTRDAVPVGIQEAWVVPDYLKEIIADDPDIARDLLQLFLEDAAENLGKLIEQVRLRNKLAIGRILHSLRGSTLQIGAIGLSVVVDYLNTEADAGRLLAVSEGMGELQSAFVIVRSEMEIKMMTLLSGESGSVQ